MINLEFEQEPGEAALVFGDQIDKARAYTARLAQDSETFGLLGPRELPRIWSRHVINSALLVELVPNESLVADVGSGAGLPGIPMAIAKPKSHFTLIEPMERRATWLQTVVDDLGLRNVDVIRARAEEVQRTDFDIVTARAVAALDKLLKLLTPLTRGSQHRTILALKGSRAPEEISEARPRLQRLGFGEPEIITLGLGITSETATVVRIILQ
ncbi:16S rRNA (guanine(527)-N(7))-methyltransferase RsmG [Aquiluna borgnonia]|uniref:16S rRNA (guanine(527)-N(7))-methyltransferase RsmG n=1 Tax=Aquiluna borgnonia TaxID=2499157 RepID=UPI001FE6CF69|nr:16S rRNA (guanine(527)-N(7))-methyltransferase RsmG [Aquiluna borgnonia]